MPEVILLKDVENVGERGAVVDVSKGYLRNYLAPRKLAQPATKGALEAVRRSQEAAEKAQEQNVADARSAAEQLDRTVLTIEQQAGDDGRPCRSGTRPAPTPASSARSPTRTSPTPSRRRAASRSTSARCPCRTRSRASGP